MNKELKTLENLLEVAYRAQIIKQNEYKKIKKASKKEKVNLMRSITNLSSDFGLYKITINKRNLLTTKENYERLRLILNYMN